MHAAPLEKRRKKEWNEEQKWEKQTKENFKAQSVAYGPR